MEAEIERLWPDADRLVTEASRAEAKYFASRSKEDLEAHRELYTRYTVADRRLLRACRAMAKIQATTVEGLICKARMTVHEDEMLVDSIVADLISMGART